MTSLERYLNSQDKIIAKDKEDTLISLGITEKEYSPDGSFSRLYSLYDYINGEKRYYREIAANISDDEYAEILKKKALVDVIQAKEQQNRERNEAARHASYAKKWVPIFKKPKEEWEGPSPNDPPATGKSKLASIIKSVAWIILIVSITASIITLSTSAAGAIILLISALIGSLGLFALAEILDNLAEQTEIMRQGYVYRESSK